MRIRTVKPEFWHHEELSELSAESNLLAIGLLNYADDEGYFKLHPKLIESTIFPLRVLSLSIHGLLSELSNVGYITAFEGSDGKKYGKIVNFLKHQRVNRPNPSKIAAILCETKDRELSVSDHTQLSESSLTEGNRKGIGMEGNRKRKVGAKAPSPSAISLPHGCDFADAWNRWTKHRSEIKKPLKPTMIEQQLKELGALSESHAVARINHTIGMGWQGLRDPEDLPVSSKADIGGRTMATTKISELNHEHINNDEHDDIPI